MHLSSEVQKAVWMGIAGTGAAVFLTLALNWVWLQFTDVIERRSVYLDSIVVPLIISPVIGWYMLRVQVRAERLAKENHRLAYTDELTGLPNRRAFFAEASQLQLQADAGAREGQGHFYCAIADVDDFKRVNDTHGHETGDGVLISVGRVLADMAPSTGIVARLGGEEFAVAGVFADAAEARAACAAMVRAVATADFGALGLSRPVTISLGVCRETGPENLSTLLNRADEALYWAKQAGKNRVAVFEDGPIPPLARVG